MTISVALRTNVIPSGGATTVPVMEFQPSATDYVSLQRIFFQAQTILSDTISIGVGIPAVAGVGLPGETTLVVSDAGDNQIVPAMKVFAHWSTPPTAPTVFFRRVAAQVVSSSFSLINLSFANGLGITPGGSLVLWLASATTAIGLICDITAEFES